MTCIDLEALTLNLHKALESIQQFHEKDAQRKQLCKLLNQSQGEKTSGIDYTKENHSCGLC